MVFNYLRIRPILYRVVAIVGKSRTLRTASGTPIIHCWPNTQIINSAQFVRHFFTMAVEGCHLLEMMSTFPNIENLAIWSFIDSPEIFKKLNDLPLRKLSAYFHDISPDRYLIKNSPAFKNLTHLEMIRLNCSTPGWHKALIGLPRLTHLAFDPTGALHVEDAVVLDLLKHCASLRVLIFSIFLGAGYVNSNGFVMSNDPRCLILLDPVTLTDLMEEWERSANGLIGGWELAEIIVDARNGNLFKDNSSLLFSRRTWMDDLNEDGMRWYEELSKGFRNGV
jgi:hypothetical protein